MAVTIKNKPLALLAAGILALTTACDKIESYDLATSPADQSAATRSDATKSQTSKSQAAQSEAIANPSALQDVYQPELTLGNLVNKQTHDVIPLLEQQGFVIKKKRNNFSNRSSIMAFHPDGSVIKMPYDQRSGKIYSVDVSLKSSTQVTYLYRGDTETSKREQKHARSDATEVSMFLSSASQLSSSQRNKPQTKGSRSGYLSAEAKCKAQGGKYKQGGLSQELLCHLPTRDGGKACSSSDQCESVCLAASRSCSGEQQNFGCIDLLENGETVTLCID